MKTEIKARLTAAMRSGNWNKGTGLMRQFKDGEVKVCSLGLLCELAKEDGLDLIPVADDPGMYPYGQPGSDGFLPFAVEQWAEMPWSEQGKVAARNDAWPLRYEGFAEMADWIEENV